MAGNAEGAKKRREALIRKYGSMEAYKEAAKDWGKRGGDKAAELGLNGFKTMTKEQKSEAGKLGHAAMIRKYMEVKK